MNDDDDGGGGGGGDVEEFSIHDDFISTNFHGRNKISFVFFSLFYTFNSHHPENKPPPTEKDFFSLFFLKRVLYFNLQK